MNHVFIIIRDAFDINYTSSNIAAERSLFELSLQVDQSEVLSPTTQSVSGPLPSESTHLDKSQSSNMNASWEVGLLSHRSRSSRHVNRPLHRGYRNVVLRAICAPPSTSTPISSNQHHFDVSPRIQERRSFALSWATLKRALSVSSSPLRNSTESVLAPMPIFLAPAPALAA